MRSLDYSKIFLLIFITSIPIITTSCQPMYFVVNEDLRGVPLWDLLQTNYQSYIIDQVSIDGVFKQMTRLGVQYPSDSYELSIHAISFTNKFYNLFKLHSFNFYQNNKLLIDSSSSNLQSGFKRVDLNSGWERYESYIYVFTNQKLHLSTHDKYKLIADCELIDPNEISYRKNIIINFTVYNYNTLIYWLLNR